MSKPVNDVRASSFDEKYAGVTFSGPMDDAIAQAKEAPKYPADPLDIRAPHGMGKDRAALLSFLRLLPQSPLTAPAGVPFSVVSAELSFLGPDINRLRSDALQSKLTELDFHFAPVLGSYAGSLERSFAVLTPRVVDRIVLEGLARQCEQESVLHVAANRRAHLFFLADGHTSAEMRWTPVGAQEALELNAWTKDSAGQYYALKSLHSIYSIEYAQEKGWLPYASTRGV